MGGISGYVNPAYKPPNDWRIQVNVREGSPLTPSDVIKIRNLTDDQLQAIWSVMMAKGIQGGLIPLLHNLITKGILGQFANNLLNAGTQEDAIDIFDKYNTKYILIPPPPPSVPNSGMLLSKPAMAPPPPPSMPPSSSSLVYTGLSLVEIGQKIQQLPTIQDNPELFNSSKSQLLRDVNNYIQIKGPSPDVIVLKNKLLDTSYMVTQPTLTKYVKDTPVAAVAKSTFMTDVRVRIPCAGYNDKAGGTNVEACRARPDCVPVVPPFSSAQRCYEKSDSNLSNPALKNSFRYL
jgi:hypothetical protein